MKRLTAISTALLAAAIAARALEPATLDVTVTGGSGSGTFAPYYIASNMHGTLTQASNALMGVRLADRQRLKKGWSYSWGIEAIGGYTSTADYQRYDATAGQWNNNPQHPSRL